MFSAKDAAKITGLSTATLRYYEKEKLLPPIARTALKYRQYVSLLRQGSGTVEQRYDMVLSYKKNIEAQISDLKNALALSQSKLMFYQDILKQPSGNNMTYLEE